MKLRSVKVKRGATLPVQDPALCVRQKLKSFGNNCAHSEVIARLNEKSTFDVDNDTERMISLHICRAF